MKTTTFIFNLDDEHALALAQFLKRAHFGTCERLSDPSNKNEPQRMMSALETVRASLARGGFTPR